MLTTDVIKANKELTGLTDAQIAAITTLSSNDENTVLASKIGELHGRYDQDVKEVTGIEKNQGEKSYEYVKRVLGGFKSKVEGADKLQGQIDEHVAEIGNLKKQITEGKGDEVIRKQLKDKEAELSTLRTQYDTDKENWKKEQDGFTSKMTEVNVNAEFDKVQAGIKFKAGYPESIQQTLLTSARSKILATHKPDWIEADGKKIMVFRDAKGEIVRNKSNSLNPYTAHELVYEQLKDVIDTGRKVTGAGTSGQGTGTDNDDVILDFSGIKTQVEADELIVKHLMKNGETRGSQSFAEKQKKLREENSVNKLPIR
jgi:hypothetical protein